MIWQIPTNHRKNDLGSDTWGISYDPITSWLCFGETISHEDDIAVAFATGCEVTLRDNQLKALWVQPIFQ